MPIRKRHRRRAEQTGRTAAGVDGWRILPRAVTTTREDVDRVAAHVLERQNVVFNPDGRRLQREMPASDPLVAKVVRALEKTGLLRGRVVGAAVGMHSLVGCAAQPLHTDYDGDQVRRAALKPLGVLLALQDGTKLALQGGHELRLRAGDLLIFDGDLVHAGAAYPDAANTRLHLYVHVPCVRPPRNVTYLIADHANASRSNLV